MIKLSVRSPYYWAWQIDGTITLREVHGGRGTLPECIYRLVGIVMKISEDYLSLKMGEIPGFYDGTVSVRVMRWITDTSCTSNVSIGLICTQWLINPGDSHSDPRTQRGTGSHRESQRDTERHRESQRVTESHRETQRVTATAQTNAVHRPRGNHINVSLYISRNSCCESYFWRK